MCMFGECYQLFFILSLGNCRPTVNKLTNNAIPWKKERETSLLKIYVSIKKKKYKWNFQVHNYIYQDIVNKEIEWYNLKKQIKHLLFDDIDDVWIIDSAFIIHQHDWYIDFQSINNGLIKLGDNKIYQTTGAGTIFIEKFINDKWISGRTENVFNVPEIRKNLFFVGTWISKGFDVEFRGHCVEIKRNMFVGFSVKQNKFRKKSKKRIRTFSFF